MHLKYKYIVMLFSYLLLSSAIMAEDEVMEPHKGRKISNTEEVRRIRQEYMHEVGITNYSKKKTHYKTGVRTGLNSLTHHLFGVYTNLAFNSIPHTSEAFSLPMGNSYGVGFCYELQRYLTRFQIGFGYNQRSLYAHVGDITLFDDMVSDAWGYPYQLRYDFQNRSDYYLNKSIQVPILMGAGTNHFYAMAGVKLKWNFLHHFEVSAIGSTSAIYEQFLGNFVEMDNHGLRKNVPINYVDEFKENFVDFNVAGTFEMGAEFEGNLRAAGSSRYVSYRKSIFDRKPEWRLRIATYCDIGFFRFRPQKYYSLVDIPSDTKWDFCTYKLNHVLYSQLTHSIPLVDISVGIKFTALFGWYINSTCKQCSSDRIMKKIANHN